MVERGKIKTLLALLASATALSPTVSIAQNADDVVVMRRVIAPPKTSNAPEPTDPNVTGPVPGSNLSGYYWVVSGWFSLPDDTCDAAAVQTRVRGCVRRGESADPALCPEPAPPTERIVSEFKGCTYSWATEPSGDWASSCSMSTTRPLSATCMREDGVAVTDSFCEGQNKPTQQTGSNLVGCTYTWNVGDFGDWEEGCSATTFRTREVSCIRSDGVTVPGTSCSQPGPAGRENGSNFSNCTYNWRSGDWSQYDSNCSVNATRTRTNSCQRSDETIVDNSLCDPSKEPPTSESMEIISGCGYQWVSGDYGEWSSTCSNRATRDRDVSCRRSDGVTVADNLCAGEKPQTRETDDVATSCTYQWEAGDWVQANACGTNNTRTRQVVCRRSDGTAAAESFCSGEKPITSDTVNDFSGCTYNWQPNEWGAWDNTCSATANRTRTASCFRSDETPADPSLCEGKPLPVLTDTQAVYTGCEKVWTTTNWSNYNSTCSATATRTRSVGCNEIRPSGAVPVALGFCDSATRPASSESTAIYTGCVNTWITGSWGWNGVTNATSNTCSLSAQQTRTVQCQSRLTDGTLVFVADSNCTTTKPSTTQIVGSFSTCQYSWLTSDWGPYNSTCSTNATRTRTVTCRRSDEQNTVVPDPSCTVQLSGAKPSTSQTVINVVDCTGILSDPGFEADGQGWTLGGNTINSSIAFSDVKSLAITTNNVIGYQPTRQTFNVQPGVQYRVTFKHRRGPSNNNGSFRMAFTNASSPVTSVFTVTPGANWSETVGFITFTSNTSTISIQGWDNLNGNLSLLLDEIVINRVE